MEQDDQFQYGNLVIGAAGKCDQIKRHKRAEGRNGELLKKRQVGGGTSLCRWA
jgi:hypothetical protein